MKTATVTEAKNGLSALIDQVKAGESVMITDRGIPVARLEPVAAHAGHSGRAQRLSRSGIARVPEHIDARGALLNLPPPPSTKASVVEALLEERRLSR